MALFGSGVSDTPECAVATAGLALRDALAQLGPAKGYAQHGREVRDEPSVKRRADRGFVYESTTACASGSRVIG